VRKKKMPNISTGYIVAAVLVVLVVGFMYYRRKEAEPPVAITVEVPVEVVAAPPSEPTDEVGEEMPPPVKDEDPTSPTDLGSPVGWTGPVSPQANPAAEGSEVYSFFPNKDSPENNLESYPDLAGKVMDLQAKCNGSKECRGFNTSGQLKSAIGDESTWTVLEGENAGLHVRHLTTTD
jgi:hypothetical protein